MGLIPPAWPRVRTVGAVVRPAHHRIAYDGRSTREEAAG